MRAAIRPSLAPPNGGLRIVQNFRLLACLSARVPGAPIGLSALRLAGGPSRRLGRLMPIRAGPLGPSAAGRRALRTRLPCRATIAKKGPGGRWTAAAHRPDLIAPRSKGRKLSRARASLPKKHCHRPPSGPFPRRASHALIHPTASRICRGLLTAVWGPGADVFQGLRGKVGGPALGMWGKAHFRPPDSPINVPPM
jgi:hypothetical protein